MSYKNAAIQKKLMFQKKFTYAKQMHQKNACFVTIDTLKLLYLNLNRMFAINVTMY